MGNKTGAPRSGELPPLEPDTTPVRIVRVNDAAMKLVEWYGEEALETFWRLAMGGRGWVSTRPARLG